MFAQLSSVVALLAVANAAPVSVTSSSAEKPAPTGWATGYLEEYKEYNIRYKALNCSTQHNTTFEDCCHPLLANETLTIRADYCTSGFAANTTASAIYATETSNNTEVYTEYCEEATSVASAVASVVATATESISQVTLTSNSSTATVVVQFAPSSSAVSSYAAEATSAEWVAPSSSAAESSSSPYVAAAAVETSSYVEPTTSTWVAPTSTYVAPTTSEAPAPAATTPAASSGGDWKTGGHATYFYQNGNAGACGWYNPDSAKVIAINGVGPNSYWTDYSKASPDCGRWVTIVNENNGKTVSAMVADVCPTCTGNGESIDLSVGAFESIADLSEGQVSIKWKWN